MGKKIMDMEGKSISRSILYTCWLRSPVEIGTVGVLNDTFQVPIGNIGMPTFMENKLLKQSLQNFFKVKEERGC